MRLMIFAVIMAMILVACGGGSDDSDGDLTLVLPTEAQLPEFTEVVTEDVDVQVDDAVTPTDEPTDAPTNTLEPTETEDVEPTITNTLPASATSAPLATLTFTPTFNIDASQTAIIAEAPVFSTLTPIPIPAGGTALPTPTLQVIAADVVITVDQLQEELDIRTEEIFEIDSARISFVEGDGQGVMVSMRASGGQALVSGDVLITFQPSGSLVMIGVANISVGSGTAPERYAEIANTLLVDAVVDAFDSILTQRLGERHDLQSITFSTEAIQIMLLVPEN